MTPRVLLHAWALTVAIGGVPAYLALGWRGVLILATSAALGQAGFLAGGHWGVAAVTLAVLLVGLLA